MTNCNARLTHKLGYAFFLHLRKNNDSFNVHSFYFEHIYLEFLSHCSRYFGVLTSLNCALLKVSKSF